MNVCMLMYREMPFDHRRVIVSHSIFKKYKYVDIICIRQKGQKATEDYHGVHYFRLPVYAETKDTNSLRLIKYCSYTMLSGLKLMCHSVKKKYDIIHVHNPPDFIILGAIPIKFIFGSRIILDLHDMLPEAIASNMDVPENHFFVKIALFIEKFSIRFSDAVICTNEYDKSILLSRNNLPPEKIFVVMNTPDLELMKIETPDKRNVMPDKKFYILFEGTIWKRRGIQSVIDAVGILKDKIPVFFFVLGDGPDLDYLKEYVDEKGLQDHVRFTGWINLKELSEYISLSDVCIIPFLQTKVNDRGVPNKLFEYIVHDKPVVSSNLRGIESTFDNHEITFFEPGNATDLAEKLLWCYNNPEKVITMTTAAKKRYYAEYTWEKMEKELYRCYESLGVEG